MPNQYSAVELTLDLNLPKDIKHIQIQYTKALFELLKNRIPQNEIFTNDLITAIMEDLY